MSSAPSSCAIPTWPRSPSRVQLPSARRSCATVKRLTLELGGKSPNILLDDADLQRAIPTALVIAFLNSGQACVAGTRLLVPKKRLDEVKRALVDTMPAFPV